MPATTGCELASSLLETAPLLVVSNFAAVSFAGDPLGEAMEAHRPDRLAAPSTECHLPETAHHQPCCPAFLRRMLGPSKGQLAAFLVGLSHSSLSLGPTLEVLGTFFASSWKLLEYTGIPKPDAPLGNALSNLLKNIFGLPLANPTLGFDLAQQVSR